MLERRGLWAPRLGRLRPLLMGRLYLDAFEGGSSLANVSAANAVPALLGIPRAARQEAEMCWFHSALCPQVTGPSIVGSVTHSSSGGREVGTRSNLL